MAVCCRQVRCWSHYKDSKKAWYYLLILVPWYKLTDMLRFEAIYLITSGFWPRCAHSSFLGLINQGAARHLRTSQLRCSIYLIYQLYTVYRTSAKNPGLEKSAKVFQFLLQFSNGTSGGTVNLNVSRLDKKNSFTPSLCNPSPLISPSPILLSRQFDYYCGNL